MVMMTTMQMYKGRLSTSRTMKILINNDVIFYRKSCYHYFYEFFCRKLLLYRFLAESNISQRDCKIFAKMYLVTISCQCCIFATNVFPQILGEYHFFNINGLLGTKSIYFAKQKTFSIKHSIIAR